MEGLVGYSGGQVGRGTVHGWVSATSCVQPHLWTSCILGTCRVSKNLSTGSSWMRLHDNCSVVLPASGPVLAQFLPGLGAPLSEGQSSRSWCCGPPRPSRGHICPCPPGPPFIVSPPENITVNISQDALLTCRAEAYPGNLTYTWYWQDENVYFQK